MSTITPLKMPKWGLSMQEGLVQDWHIREGDRIVEGQEIVDVETSKITNVFEAPYAGRVARIVARSGETIPVGALLAVIAEEAVSASDIEAFILAFQDSFTPELEQDAGGPMEQRVDIGDGRVLRASLMGEGAGDAVVFVHGFGGNLDDWAAVQPAIAARARTVALDLPGHGGSTKMVGAGDIASLSEAISAALKQIGVGRAHLVGHSLGATVVLAFALANPERVASVTLLCPAGAPGGTLNQDYLRAFLNATRGRDLAKALELLFADPSMATRDLAEQILRTKRLDGVEAALSAIHAAMSAPSFADLGLRMAEVAAPLTILASKEDQIVGRLDEAALPSSVRLVWIDGVGHMPHVEKPSAVIAEIAAQLR